MGEESAVGAGDWGGVYGGVGAAVEEFKRGDSVAERLWADGMFRRRDAL